MFFNVTILWSVQEYFMQFYIIYLKELKEQFHVYSSIVQLFKRHMGFRK